jgi:tRNA (guanine37-N1)-methyltransferase
MRIDIITIFPEAFSPLDLSIIGRAREAGFLNLRIHNLRDFTTDRHRKVDDKSFGGGVGMVMMVGPVAKALKKARKDNPKTEIIMLSPAGQTFNQSLARKFSKKKGLILLCGHYEGMDERVADLCDRQISIGDYILSAGETAALVVVDAVTRLLPGVLPEDATEQDSFSDNLLDWPHYTRPARWRKVEVPKVLLSGDHKKIAAWRQKTAEERTKKLRPDLWKKYLKKRDGKT